MELLLENYPNSLFCDVCVRKTLTHYKGIFGWFNFSFKVCFDLVLVWKEVSQ